MNVSVSNGVVINSKNRIVIVNGKEIPFHSNMKGNSITAINNKAYVDGYELINGEWKKTLKALWYKLF